LRRCERSSTHDTAVGGRGGVVNDDLLRESLVELYEQAPCGYIFTLPDGSLVRVNQTFLDWTGYARDDLVSEMRFQDLLTVPGRIFYENQYDPLLRMQGFVNEVAFDLVRKDRSRLPVLVNSIQRRDDGRPILTASIVFDATQRRQYEHELLLARRRAEDLAAVVTYASDAIVRTSPAGDVESWNDGAAHLFGYAAQDVIGHSLSDIVTLADDPGETSRIMSELRAGRPIQLERTAAGANKRPTDISIAITPHMGLLGELIATSLIIRDISERRALERLQQEFLAMASHELRNPVAAIRGHAQLMQRRGTYSDRSVNVIVSQSDQLRKLIDDLLLASQIEADRLDLHRVETDVSAEARLAVEGVQASRPALRVTAPAEPVVVLADQLRLRQVFANLLTNAIKYSPEGSEVVMGVIRRGEHVQVAVTDHGVGIPHDALPHLFDRFFRAEGAAHQAQGLGLGLYISRRIVEAHGGAISVESKRGRGSTFTITLPLLGTR
jgi:PAS domain S-box-containing protein